VFISEPQRSIPWYGRYAITALLVVSAVALTGLFPEIFRGVPFFLFWPTVILSAWISGFIPGLIASIVAVFSVTYIFRFNNDLVAPFQLALFFVITAAISWIYQRRQQTEATALEQNEWLRVTLTSIGDGVIATDADGKVVFINPVASTLTGWTRAEALGKPIQDVFNIVNESTRQPVPIPLMEALQKGAIVGLANHTVLIGKDRREKPIMDSGAPIKDRNGKVIGAVLVFRDRSEQREAARVQETLELVMSGIDEGFIIFDNEWHFTYANRRAGELGMDARGRSHEELMRMTMEEAFPEMVGSHVYNEVKAAGVDKTSRHFEEYVEPYNRWYEYRIYPTTSGLGIFAIDITERKRIEQKFTLLQQLTAEFTAALTPQDVAEIVISKGFALFGGHLGSVNLLREDNTLEILRGRGNTPEVLARFPLLSMDQRTPGADAIRYRKPIFIETADEYREQYPQLFNTLQPMSGTQALAALPLIVNEQAIGSIVITFNKPMKLSSQERDFMLTLAHQAAQALKRALLSARTQEMVAVQERQRLAQDLHDSVSQALFSATTIAQAIPLTFERSPEKALEQLQQVVEINRAAMSEMRILLLELRPQTIMRTPLIELLRHLIDAAKGRKIISANLTAENEEITLPSEVHVALYRIAQESVNNVLKHSEAKRFEIRLQNQGEQVILTVQDNGRGFDQTQDSSGMGLVNLRERAEEIGAELVITSAPGEGTTIRVTWDKPTESLEATS
jgi:PAS domain S-box-containing protein